MGARNPVVSASGGDRQMWCIHYGKCLDLAARENWPGFSCEACDFRDKGIPADPDPMFAIRALAWAVLHPRRWARFVAVAERMLLDD